jgi:hypothetical protein
MKAAELLIKQRQDVSRLLSVIEPVKHAADKNALFVELCL